MKNGHVLLQTEATEMQGWLADIEVLGANLSEELQAELRQRSGKKEGRHTQDPLLAVAQSLMSEDWRRFVREEPWILDDVNETLEAVWKQEEFPDQLLNSVFTKASIKRNIDEISLIARRHLLSRSVGEYAPLVHEIPDVLPRPSSRPGKVVYDHKRPNEVIRYHVRRDRLFAGEFVFQPIRFGKEAPDDTEDEECEDEAPPMQKGAGKNAQTAVQKRARILVQFRGDREVPQSAAGRRHYRAEAESTRNLAANSFIEPPALDRYLKSLNEVARWRGYEEQSKGDLALALTFLLSLEHGIPPKDVPNIGLNPDASALGWIDVKNGEAFGRLHIKIGSYYYPSGARAFRPSVFVQRLSAELTKALLQAIQWWHVHSRSTGPFKDPALLVDLVPGLYQAALTEWQRFMYEHYRGYKTHSFALHHGWEKVVLATSESTPPLHWVTPWEADDGGNSRVQLHRRAGTNLG